MLLIANSKDKGLKLMQIC